MNKFDVLIIGGGIMGNSIAWQLSKRGKSVVVIEKNDVASGAAGATDGVVGYHTKKPGAQLDLAVESIKMFDNLSTELNFDIEFEKNSGGMQPVEDKEQWDMLEALVIEQRKSGVDVKMISREEALEIEPQLASDIYGALYSKTGAKVNPIALTMAFSKAAKALGAVIKTNTKVTDFIIDGANIRGVKTDKGDFYADIIVNSAGAWAGEIAKLARLSLPIKPRKGQLAVTEPIAPFMRATVQCALYNIIKFRPETITDKAVLRLGSSLSIEQTECGSIIIGGTREFEDFNDENSFEAITVMMNRASRFLPLLKDVSIVRFFSGFRPYTPDGLPLLGKIDSFDNFYMAAGHEGDGIALSPITGKLICELICDGKSSYDLSDFNPNRFL